MVILASFALDILALFASEASAERVFSHCGDLTRGKRNKEVTFERSEFLMNRKLFQKVGVTQTTVNRYNLYGSTVMTVVDRSYHGTLV